MLTLKQYREQLADEGITLIRLWSIDDPEEKRFTLTAYQAFSDGEWSGTVILQELEGGQDGILTYAMLPSNTVEKDATAIRAFAS